MPRLWTRDELLIAMNLYGRLAFGQLDRKNPMIMTVAAKLRRTPDALAMKLCNLASLDPAIRHSGRSGLSGTSRLDREIWEAFESDWETMGVESEQRYRALTNEDAESPRENMQLVARKGATEIRGEVMLRLGQDFFRRTVLVGYGHRCCVTGNPLPELLTASHIVSWAKDQKERLNPRNGLCLAKTQDAAFDRHLITLDEDLRLVVSKSIREHYTHNTIQENFARFEGRKISLPERFLPDPHLLERHREQFAAAG